MPPVSKPDNFSQANHWVSDDGGGILTLDQQTCILCICHFGKIWIIPATQWIKLLFWTGTIKYLSILSGKLQVWLWATFVTFLQIQLYSEMMMMHNCLWSHGCEVNCCKALLIQLITDNCMSFMSFWSDWQTRLGGMRTSSRRAEPLQETSSPLAAAALWFTHTSRKPKLVAVRDWREIHLKLAASVASGFFGFVMPLGLACFSALTLGLLLVPTVLHPKPPPGSSSQVPACRAASYAQILRSTPGAPPWQWLSLQEIPSEPSPHNELKAKSTPPGDISVGPRCLCWSFRPSMGNFCKKSTSDI